MNRIEKKWKGKCYVGRVPLCSSAATYILLSLVQKCYVTFPTNRYEIKSLGINAFTKWWNGFYMNEFLVHKNKLPSKKNF